MKFSSPAVRLSLSIAVAMVVGAATWRSLTRARAEQGIGGPASRVLIVRKFVAAGKAVTSADVETRFIPAAFAEPGVYRDVKELSGARARILLSKGEQLTRSKIENESARLGLAWSLPPGQTAVALRLTAEGAVGGHVLPGDWVSVVACPPRGRAAEVIRRVRVGAVGEKVWDPAGAPGSPPPVLAANEFFLVTLLLAPEQAARLISAGEQGRLTLTLISPLDDAGGGRVHHAG